MRLELPIRTVSEANAREHWAAKHRRAKAQRQRVWAELLASSPPSPPLTVTLTRIGKRRLDDDNLARAFKSVRDEVACWLGIDDGDTAAVTWRYQQECGREYGIIIEVEKRHE